MSDLYAVGTYIDKHLTLEKLARNIPMIREVAIPDIVKRHLHYRQEGPDLINIFTKKKIQEEINEAVLRKECPHYFADYAPITEEQLLQEKIEAAFLGSTTGGPTLKARGELRTMVGERQYQELAELWNVDLRTLKPGTRPAGTKEEEAAAKKVADAKANPWTKEGWSLAAQGRYVTEHGLDAAKELAARVGCVVGSTRPNPKYN